MTGFEAGSGAVKYLKTIEGFAKAGEINVGFNYSDNGINHPPDPQVHSAIQRCCRPCSELLQKIMK